jgi:hypothetical protein
VWQSYDKSVKHVELQLQAKISRKEAGHSTGQTYRTAQNNGKWQDVFFHRNQKFGQQKITGLTFQESRFEIESRITGTNHYR